MSQATSRITSHWKSSRGKRAPIAALALGITALTAWATYQSVPPGTWNIAYSDGTTGQFLIDQGNTRLTFLPPLDTDPPAHEFIWSPEDNCYYCQSHPTKRYCFTVNANGLGGLYDSNVGSGWSGSYNKP